MWIDELFDGAMTITAASGDGGNIDRAKADRITDPRGYFGKPRRSRKHKLAEHFDPATIPAPRLKALADAGFDTSELLYHGSNTPFQAFAAEHLKTARHFYTTPDPRTAASYGDIIYACFGRQAPQADLTGDSVESARTLDHVASLLAPYHQDAVEDSLEPLRQSMIDKLLADHADDGEDELTLPNGKVVSSPIYDEFAAEDEVAASDEYKSALLQASKAHLVELITSGTSELYGTKGYLQDDVMAECFSLGYRSVYFFDYNSAGEPISVVFKDAADIAIVGQISADEAIG